MTIYDIDKEIFSLVDTETGEIKDYEAFEQLQLDRDLKIENIALWIKDLLGDAEKIKAEKEKLYAREKACKNKAEGLKKLLDYALQGQAFKSDKAVISYRKSTKCVISDENEFIKNHPEYVNRVTEEKIVLSEITKAIKAGETVTGAQLVESNNIQVK